MIWTQENKHVCSLSGVVYSDQLATLKVETLSDDSKVYGVNILDQDGQIAITLEMDSKESALELLKQIEKHSIDTMSLY